MKILVRCEDRSVFEVDPVTLDPKTCGCYDAYCYSDPRPDVVYMGHSEWTVQHQNKMMQRIKESHGFR